MGTVLVTGALGTLGRWTVAELAGAYDVVGVDLRQPEDGRGDVDYVAADLTEQGPAWELVADVEPDAVVHLAAIPGAGRRAGTETFVTNVESTYNVLGAAGRVGAEVVWSSSEATYGVTFREEARPLEYLPIDEGHPTRPEGAYGTSKVVGEEVAAMVSRRYGIPVASIRPSWIQVPGRYGTAAIRDGFDPSDPTPSGSLWSYVDVRDVATMIRLAIEADREGHEAYLAVAADNYLDYPTAEAIEAAWGERPVACDLEGDEAAFTTAKAREGLGWTPDHSWREAETADVEPPGA